MSADHTTFLASVDTLTLVRELGRRTVVRDTQGQPDAEPGDHAAPQEPDAGGFIRQRELLANLGVSRSTLWSWRQKGLFPEPVRLGPQAKGWRRSDVAAWRRRKGI